MTVGITGGLGAGKSAAASFLEEKGAYVFDADVVAKELLKSDPEIKKKLIDAFGTDILKNGEIDNERLAKVSFIGEENQNIINDIIHPRVIAAFREKLEELDDKYELVVVDAPLIFESGFDNHLDHTVLIYTQYKIRLERAIRRGTLSREEILRRMELQMPEEEKRELASFIIDNSGTPEQLKSAMESLYQKLMS
ncbi:MAG: dephospho-CoA kinase [Candidatus Marinimicrobia bacterium]|nr:dephospho-CoA kinase [Candidatus Neomarinimicrobiota bacterium]